MFTLLCIYQILYIHIYIRHTTHCTDYRWLQPSLHVQNVNELYIPDVLTDHWNGCIGKSICTCAAPAQVNMDPFTNPMLPFQGINRTQIDKLIHLMKCTQHFFSCINGRACTLQLCYRCNSGGTYIGDVKRCNQDGLTNSSRYHSPASHLFPDFPT